MRQLGVVRRIPNTVVDTVKDTDEIRRTSAEQTVEPAAMLRSQDFACVVRTNRCQSVAVPDTGLDEGYLLVELDPVWRQSFRRQAQTAKSVQRKITLEGEIMNRENGLRRRFAAVSQECGRHPSMPVISVDDLRAPTEGRPSNRNQCGGSTERSEAVIVVGPILAAAILIEAAVALEESGSIEQDHRHVRVRHATHQQPALGQIARIDNFHVADKIERLRITRHHDADVRPQTRQGGGKSPGDIGEAAGLSQRKDFRGDKQNTGCQVGKEMRVIHDL